MKVLFVEVDTERTWAIASIGPAFIAPYLSRHGHETAFLRAKLEMSAAELIAAIRAQAPDLLGFSLTSRQWQRARTLVRTIRAELDIPVVAGGLHPTFAPEDVLAQPGFDYVCLGEGEQPALDLVEALAAGRSTEGIQNIWTRGGTRPSLRPPFEPVDDLPFMDRGFLDEYQGAIHMCTQRGCPFPCTYCAARMYNQLYGETGASYGRRRSHDNVLAELHAIRARQTLSYVIFLDDTFTIHHPWVKEFCRRYGPELGLPFSLHARVETVNERLLHMLAEAGCSHITYGVESGSERVRREVMRRPVTNERFREVFRWTREAGIMVTANYIIGLPTETRDELEETLALAEELNAYDFGYFVFYPYPGTQLFHECRQRGLLPEDYREMPANHRESILRLEHITQADISEFYDRFTALRERLYLARLGPQGSAEARAATIAHTTQSAARG